MCDYSQHINLRCVRDAKVGDQLSLHRFGGFIDLDSGRVTCIKTGTELVLDRRPLFVGVRTPVRCDNGEIIYCTDLAVSREARMQRAPRPLGQGRGADVLEFANGSMIGLRCLPVGLRVTVLQLPVMRKRAKPKVDKEKEALDRRRRQYLYSLQRRKRKQEAKAPAKDRIVSALV